MPGLFRTWKESKPVRGTHFLERAEGGTGQNMERKQVSEGHLQPGDGRVQDWTEDRRK